MLNDIRCGYIRKKGRITDKAIAEDMGIDPVTFSRLITEIVTPRIMTWYKITKKHSELWGEMETAAIIDGIEL